MSAWLTLRDSPQRVYCLDEPTVDFGEKRLSATRKA
jgi:hypothetical protein